MRLHGALRVLFALTSLALLAMGLWHCDRESTAPGSGALQFALRTQGLSAGQVDSIEIEITRNGAPSALDTIAIGEGGAFSATFALEAGGPYRVDVFARGEGSDLVPDSLRRGVLAYGREGGLELEPGRLTEVDLELAEATVAIDTLWGNVGSRTLELRWAKASGATGYTLGWYDPGTEETGYETDLADTTLTLSWDGPVGAYLLRAGEDTLQFAVQPHFGTREGVFGPTYGAFLAQWMLLPQLLEFWPDNAEEVPVDEAFVFLRFDRPLDTETIDAGVFWEESATGSAVPDTLIFTDPDDGSQFHLQAEPGALEMGTTYRVRITSDLTDLEGRPFDAAPQQEGLQSALIEWSTKPYDPLMLIEMIPGPGSMDVDPLETIRLRMNHRIDYATLSDSSVYITNPAGEPVPAVRDTAETARFITVTPLEPMWFETTYKIHITPNLVSADGWAFDNNGLTYPELEPIELPFTIEAQPLGPRVLSVIPDSGAVAVPVMQTITVEFSMPVDSATVVANQSFWLKRGGSFGVNGQVRPIGGNPRFYRFTPASQLQENTMYEVEVTPDVINLDGHALDQDRDEPGYQSFIATFVTENPPRVIAAEPPEGGTGAPVDEPIELTFSADLDPASVTSETVQLRGAGLVPLSCTRELDAPDHLLLTPEEPLAYWTTYQVWVDTLVTALDGSYFDQSDASGRQAYTAFFVTEPESLHPRVDLVYPETGAEEVPVSDSVAVSFTSPVKPSTVGAQSFLLTRTSGAGIPEAVTAETIEVSSDSLQAVFYPAEPLDHGRDYEIEITTAVANPAGFGLDQDPDSEGLQPFVSQFTTLQEAVPPRVIFVDPADGAQDVAVTENIIVQFSEPMDSASVVGAFSVSAGSDTLTGAGVFDDTKRFWAFQPDPEMAYGTVYTVAVDTTAIDLVGNRLDQNTVSPELDGFASTFTTVDETTSPMVLGMEPATGSDSVDVEVTLRVTFSEPVDPATVEAPGSFTVGPDGGEVVSGLFAYESDGAVVAWTPEAPLAFSTTYRVTCNTTITDLYGNPLDQDPVQPGEQLWRGSFTTWDETIPPRVSALLPEESPVPITVTPIVVFTEPIDPVSLDGAVSISDGQTLVSFTPELTQGADSLHLVLADPLEQNTTYTVTVDTLVADTLGNRLDQDELLPGRQAFIGQLTTEADLEPPTLIGLSPFDGAMHEVREVTAELEFSEPLDPATVSQANIYMTGPGGQVTCELVPGPYYQTIELVPDAPLAAGETYGVHVSTLVRDLAHRQFDGDPETPGNQAFESTFRIGLPPVLVWDGGICAVGDSAVVVFDATASYERDSLLADSVAVVTWIWGDGQEETLPGPAGLWASHDYGVIDAAGCDGLDNDGDGDIDETGPDGCDESYHVILELTDAYGFSVRDTAGVSFCAFLVVGSDPEEGEEQVRPDEEVRITFSRPVDPDSISAESVVFEAEGGGAVAYTGSLEEGGTVLVLDPDADLVAGDYTVTITENVVDEDGQRLDQDPSTPENDPFVLTFSVNSLPVMDWDRGQCLLGESSLVSFDASGSSDPDVGDEIAWVVWTWGDGDRDSLAAPEGLATAHEYPSQDINGCDGLDNDGDGDIDETGPDGCDESYRVILRVYDTHGASVADTAGVSFCAFVVSASDPVQGETNVPVDAVITVTFTRDVDPATVDGSSVVLRTGGGSVPVTRAFPVTADELVITPDNPMNAGGTYELTITSDVTDATGVALDQDPETPADDSFILIFDVAAGD